MTVPESVSAISEWVRTESPSSNAAGVNRMMDLVEADIEGTPVQAERIPGREGLGDMLILRAGPNNAQPHIQILSHLDTVHPIGTLTQGLPLRVDGDRLYGPGVYDMKGGAWLALQALKDCVAQGTLTRPVEYLFSCDEEVGSPTSRGVIEKLAVGAVASLVTEPARNGGKIVTARKGTGNFDIRLEGRAAHAGVNHDKGRSSIREAARLVLALEDMTDYRIGTTVNVGTISGGTVTNVVPQFSQITVDCRVCTPTEGENLAQRILALRAHDPDVQTQINGGMNRPPFEKTPEISDLLTKAQAVAAGLGFALEDCPMTGGGSDANFVAALGVPTLDGLGIDGDGAHTLHEYGLISSIDQRRALMRGLLMSL